MVQNIGEYLAKRRQDIGLMQNEVGSYVGVSKATISLGNPLALAMGRTSII